MGDQSVDFDALYETFQPRIVRYLTKLVGEYEAEDLAQEVFVKASRHLVDFRGDSQLSTWLYRIATNTALDRIRTKSFSRVSSGGESGNPQPERIPGLPAHLSVAQAPSPPPDQQFAKSQTARCIRAAVRRLPDNYRSVIVLSDFEGLKHREIAGVLGLTVEAVKVRLHRARAKLKKSIEDNCHVYHDEYDDLTCEVRLAFGDVTGTIGVTFSTVDSSNWVKRRERTMKFDPKLEELIAIGAAVAVNCQSCVEFHVAKGLDAGLSREEMAAAVEVGKMVRNGAAAKMDKFAPSVIEGKPVTIAASEGCCG